MQEELILLRGTVAAIVYQNAENGYTVLRLRCEDEQTVTVVGTIPLMAVGERLMITGKWGNHANYGKQFFAEYLERLMPQSREDILAFLSSGAIKGIGAVLAVRIVDRFGEQSLEVIEHHSEQLSAVNGISVKKAKEISESFCRQAGMRRLIEFMTTHYLPAELAVRIYKVYGDLSMEALRDNPYLLTEEYFGAEFAVVDAFAISCGVEAEDCRRIEAGIIFELTHNLNNGHTFLPTQKLLEATQRLLDVNFDAVEAGMERLQAQRRVYTDQVKELPVCYLPQYYEAEVYLTARLLTMAKQYKKTAGSIDKAIESIERKQKITYATQQRQAMKAAVNHGLLILTGGPGTGKTTTLAGILDLFDSMKLKTMLAAPTGRAAKRLTELTGREASTIHRLLEVDISPQTGAMHFVHDESEPLSCDAVIVDETSMVDLLLMEALVKALPDGCRLILVGDPDQLPSVGAGNLFSDLIRSECVKTVRLTEIFRQARESLIVMNAHAVNNGQMPKLDAKDQDFFFMRRMGAESVVQTVCELCSKRLPEHMHISAAEIQVLSPTKKGECGTYYLNKALQSLLNPPSEDKREKKMGDFIFREGDRVMQNRNNYDILWKKTDGHELGTGIFNGDIGIIETIDPQAETVRICFDDRQAEYSYEMLMDIEPAYAMTVHKSQGSEYRAVILTAYRGSEYLLTRNVLYTAITRARELLIVVGNEAVIDTMVQNNRRLVRYSGLKWRMRKQQMQT